MGKQRHGEDELIDAFKTAQNIHSRVQVGSGDDCAILLHPDGKSVISTDMLVENVHFKWDWSSAAEIGARAAVQNMADIAAMGAVQHSAVVCLGIPKELNQEKIIALVDGFTKTYERAGGAVVGGDISTAGEMTIAVTVIGDLQGRSPLLRAGAQAGDAVIFAGNLGFSPAGYEILARGIDIAKLPSELIPVAKQAVALFKVPVSPLESGVLAAKAGAHALMDVSDGLARDAGKVARDSGINIELSTALLQPYIDRLSALADYLEVSVMDWILGGGEDHGLVGTCDPEQIPQGFSRIGVCHSNSSKAADITLDKEPLIGYGWDHFSS